MSFKRFDTEDITISAESIVAPAWTGQVSTLTAMYTGSQVNTPSGQYYYTVYPSPSVGSEEQFSIAFGNKVGSGSVPFSSTEVGKSPSSVIYGQYRTLINGDEDTDFTFGANTAPDSIYVISVNRARFKEKLLPGSFNLTLSGSGNSRIQLTDNSLTINTLSYLDAGRVYDIISGSDGQPATQQPPSTFFATSGSYGQFLPDVGIIILNANAIKDTVYGIGVSASLDNTVNPVGGNSNQRIFNAIANGKSFSLRSEETVTSNYIFVRVRNSEFNYSTNPSNITGSGDLRHTVMVNTPQAYITTVGMYNDNNDLLGVAKLSRSLLKDFTKEALVRIKLDY